MIYLDNSSTTRPCAEAVEAVSALLRECWGNPSSGHSLGVEAARRLSLARGQVAAALGAEDPKRIFFTSGGTEADNWAIFAAVQRLGKRGRHIVTTAVEHHAVLHPLRRLEALGFEVTCLPPDEGGFVSADALSAALRPDTILVSVMMVNNESGAVMPLEAMLRQVRRRCPEALFHTDAVQGFGKLPFRARTLKADLITVSGHKVHGPKGVGALYVRPGLQLPPLLYGGGQEGGLRSGTEALPAICGFGAACAAFAPRLRRDAAHMARLRDLCRERLAAIPGVVLYGQCAAPHIVGVSIPGRRSQEIINRLQDREIYVSAGSACARGRRSHVLEAMNLPPAVIDGAVRVSLSAENTEADVEALAGALRTCFGRTGCAAVSPADP